MPKILLLEDDAHIGKAVHDALTSQRYTVEWVRDGDDALHRATVSDYDLLILDWTVPGKTGLQVCAEFRLARGTTMILMLTGRHSVSDKVAALESGADDYLAKPFHVDELMARVKALIRRTGAGELACSVLTVGDLSLDQSTCSLTREGKSVELVPKEFALIELLMRYPGVVLSSDAIFRRIWKSDADTSIDMVRTHIMKLRKKLECTGKPSPIETVHGVGYRLKRE